MKRHTGVSHSRVGGALVCLLCAGGCGGNEGGASGGGATSSTAGGDGSGGSTVTPGGGVTSKGGAGVAGSAHGGAAENGGSGGSIVLPPVTGEPGIWENVTPAGMSLSWTAPASGVVHHVLTDPARPMDAYAFTSDSQGVWKSTDYGTTWTRIDDGSLTTGSQRASAIDSNKLRDPETPPTLWTVNSGGGDSLWKSTDGGVAWSKITLPYYDGSFYDQDPYSFAVDPYDGAHLIMGFHGTAELAESSDAGETWTVVSTPTGFGNSVYPFFVDTGDADTTRGNWLSQAQHEDGLAGMWRTTSGGAEWTQVSFLEHAHGSGQVFDAGDGVLYAAGLDYAAQDEGHGVYRSEDYGMSWSLVNDGTIQNAVYGTPNFIYADYGWADASGAGTSEPLQRAPREPGTEWSDYGDRPSGMVNGSDHVAVTFDGARYILLAGDWEAGIWRYIEP